MVMIKNSGTLYSLAFSKACQLYTIVIIGIMTSKLINIILNPYFVGMVTWFNFLSVLTVVLFSLAMN